ncbi:hypothetical protein 1 [Beihai picorna-like virus 112]|uniref:hypothetical protein 1 n=1 Tax=Beihai picorna-like virus 112 TaxID=1922541 RepID=UPI00090B4731|nr:hypothetical protein 1 [Beihai picorna-like virus 112]APG78878.1 hypothetical protein 1 [Beihai picorna-like virus 112]
MKTRELLVLLLLLGAAPLLWKSSKEQRTVIDYGRLAFQKADSYVLDDVSYLTVVIFLGTLNCWVHLPAIVRYKVRQRIKRVLTWTLFVTTFFPLAVVYNAYSYWKFQRLRNEVYQSSPDIQSEEKEKKLAPYAPDPEAEDRKINGFLYRLPQYKGIPIHRERNLIPLSLLPGYDRVEIDPEEDYFYVPWLLRHYVPKDDCDNVFTVFPKPSTRFWTFDIEKLNQYIESEETFDTILDFPSVYSSFDTVPLEEIEPPVFKTTPVHIWCRNNNYKYCGRHRGFKSMCSYCKHGQEMMQEVEMLVFKEGIITQSHFLITTSHMNVKGRWFQLSKCDITSLIEYPDLCMIKPPTDEPLSDISYRDVLPQTTYEGCAEVRLNTDDRKLFVLARQAWGQIFESSGIFYDKSYLLGTMEKELQQGDCGSLLQSEGKIVGVVFGQTSYETERSKSDRTGLAFPLSIEIADELASSPFRPAYCDYTARIPEHDSILWRRELTPREEKLKGKPGMIATAKATMSSVQEVTDEVKQQLPQVVHSVNSVTHKLNTVFDKSRRVLISPFSIMFQLSALLASSCFEAFLKNIIILMGLLGFEDTMWRKLLKRTMTSLNQEGFSEFWTDIIPLFETLNAFLPGTSFTKSIIHASAYIKAISFLEEHIAKILHKYGIWRKQKYAIVELAEKILEFIADHTVDWNNWRTNAPVKLVPWLHVFERIIVDLRFIQTFALSKGRDNPSKEFVSQKLLQSNIDGINKLIDAVNQSRAQGVPRATPVACLIYGQSHIGKSTITDDVTTMVKNEVFRQLALKVYAKEQKWVMKDWCNEMCDGKHNSKTFPSHEPRKLPTNFKPEAYSTKVYAEFPWAASFVLSNVWSKNIADEYDTGYAGQELAKVEEAFQDTSQKEHPVWLTWISGVPYGHNMASLDTKGIPDRTRFIVATSNTCVPNASATIYDASALINRFFQWNPENMLGGKKYPDLVDGKRVYTHLKGDLTYKGATVKRDAILSDVIKCVSLQIIINQDFTTTRAEDDIAIPQVDCYPDFRAELAEMVKMTPENLDRIRKFKGKMSNLKDKVFSMFEDSRKQKSPPKEPPTVRFDAKKSSLEIFKEQLISERELKEGLRHLDESDADVEVATDALVTDHVERKFQLFSGDEECAEHRINAVALQFDNISSDFQTEEKFMLDLQELLVDEETLTCELMGRRFMISHSTGAWYWIDEKERGWNLFLSHLSGGRAIIVQTCMTIRAKIKKQSPLVKTIFAIIVLTLVFLSIKFLMPERVKAKVGYRCRPRTEMTKDLNIAVANWYACRRSRLAQRKLASAAPQRPDCVGSCVLCERVYQFAAAYSSEEKEIDFFYWYLSTFTTDDLINKDSMKFPHIGIHIPTAEELLAENYMCEVRDRYQQPEHTENRGSGPKHQRFDYFQQQRGSGPRHQRNDYFSQQRHSGPRNYHRDLFAQQSNKFGSDEDRYTFSDYNPRVSTTNRMEALAYNLDYVGSRRYEYAEFSPKERSVLDRIAKMGSEHNELKDDVYAQIMRLTYVPPMLPMMELGEYYFYLFRMDREKSGDEQCEGFANLTANYATTKQECKNLLRDLCELDQCDSCYALFEDTPCGYSSLRARAKRQWTTSIPQGLHFPGHSFTGPGTNNIAAMTAFREPTDHLDAISRAHDVDGPVFDNNHIASFSNAITKEGLFAKFKKVFSSGPAKITTDPSVKHKEEAVADDGGIQLAKSFQNNMVQVRSTGMYQQTVHGVASGLKVYTVAHIVEEEDDVEVYKQNGNDWEFLCKPSWYRHPDSEIDMAILILPKTVAPFKNIDKFIPTQEDVSEVLATQSIVQYLPMAGLLFLGGKSQDFITSTSESTGLKRTNLIKVLAPKAAGIPSRPGDCGGFMLALNTRLKRKFIGLHIGSVHSGVVLSVAITQERIKECLHMHRDQGARERIDDFKILTEDETKMVPDHLGSVCKSTIKSAPQPRSRLRKSIFHSRFIDLAKEPSALTPRRSAHTKPNKKGKDDLMVGNIEPWFESQPTLSYSHKQILKKVTKDWMKSMPKPSATVPVFNEREVLNGKGMVPGTNFSASAGIMWKGAKKDFVRMNAMGYYEFNDEKKTKELKAYLDQKEKDALKGKEHLEISSVHLKDEVRPVVDGNVKKTRMFVCNSFSAYLHEKKFLGPFLNYFYENGRKLYHGVGIDPLSCRWGEMMSYLSGIGDNFFDGDFKNFDRYQSKEFLNAAWDIIESWTMENVRYTNRTGLRNVLRGCRDQFVNSTHYYDGDIFDTDHGNPSGHTLTTVINCLVNVLYHKFLFAVLTETDPVKHNMQKNFDKHVRMVVFGDDVLVSVSDEMKEVFNLKTLSDSFKQLGQTYTPGNKTGEYYTTQPLIGSTFLKRTTRKTGLMYEAALEWDSIITPFKWTTLLESDVQGYQSLITESLIEASLHGPNRYHSLIEAIKPVALNRGFSLLTFKEARQAFRKHYFNVKSQYVF